MLTRRIWSHRDAIAFWSLWLSAVAAFVALAFWAGHRYALPLDERVTFGVQELYRYAWADRFFQIVNDLGSEETVTFVLFAAFAIAVLRGLRYEALMLAGAGAIRYVQLGVRALVHRPDELFNSLRANFDGLAAPRNYPDPNGFPSGHVLGATVVYGLIFAYVPRAVAFKPLTWLVRAFCVFEMALIGPARMYTAAHWFSDVIGAALLAGIYLALAWKIDGAIKHLRAVAVERDLAADAGLSVQPRGKRRFGRTPRPTSTAVAAERATREPEPITRS